jgi:hypothetical protein
MTRSVRAFFLSRLLREKLLLVAFAGIAVVIWASGFSSRAGVFWRKQKATTAELKVQDQWLNNEQRIDQAAKKSAAQLEPSRTLDGTRLLTKVRQIANEAGLSNTITQGITPPVTNGQFSVQTLSFQINDADWEKLKKFYVLLNQNSPYIAIDQFILSPRANNPAQLTLTLKVSAVEVAH